MAARNTVPRKMSKYIELNPRFRQPLVDLIVGMVDVVMHPYVARLNRHSIAP